MARVRLAVVAVALTAFGTALTLAVVAPAAQAHEYYLEEYADPPPWFWETLGPDDGASSNPLDCVAKRRSYQLEDPVFVTGEYHLDWGSATSPLLNSCIRSWGSGDVECTGGTTHDHSVSKIGGPDWVKNHYGYRCLVWPSGKPLPEGDPVRLGRSLGRRGSTESYCFRSLSFVYDSIFDESGSWEPDSGWQPYDCRAELTGWPNMPNGDGGDGPEGDDAACRRAKRRVERAKERLQEAETAHAKQAAKRKLAKAKRKKRRACS